MRTFIAAAYQRVGRGTGGRGKPYRPADVNGVGVEPQRNNWSCGPAALRYCLLVYGIDVSAARLAELAGSTRAGTDEAQLTKAARRVGCKLHSHTRRSPVTAKKFIQSSLRHGTPLILCVEKWQHWIAVLHCSRRGYLIFDSSRPGPVIQLRTWAWVEKQVRLDYCKKFRSAFKRTRAPVYSALSLARPVQRRSR